MPLITENDFNEYVQFYDDPNTSPEDQLIFAKAINKYREQQEELGLSLTPQLDEQAFKAQQTERENDIKMFSDVKSVTDFIPNEYRPVFDIDDETRAEYANKVMMQKMYGENVDYGIAKQSYINEFSKDFQPSSEQDFYGLLKTKVKTDEMTRQRKENSAKIAIEAASNRVDFASAVSKYKTELQNEFNLDAFTEQYNRTNDLLNPYNKDMTDFMSAMRLKMDGESTEKEENTLKEFSKKLVEMPAINGRAVLASLATQAVNKGKEFADENKNFVQETFESFGRIYSGALLSGGARVTEKALKQIPIKGEVTTSILSIKTLADAEEYVQEKTIQEISRISQLESPAALGELPTEPVIPDAVVRTLTEEETELIEKARAKSEKAVRIEREIRTIGNSLDPVRESWLGLTASTLGSSAALLPLAVSPAGLGITTKIYADLEYNDLRSNYPTMDINDAENISLVSGAVQGALDRFNIKFLQKGLPNVSKLISGDKSISVALTKSLFTKGTVGYTVEFGVEGVQDFTTPVVQGIFAAIDSDITDVDIKSELNEWIETRADVAIGLIPLVLLGAGGSTYADKVNLKKVLNDDISMQLVGIQAEDRAVVLQLTQEGRDTDAVTALQDAWTRRDRKAVANTPQVTSLQKAQELGIIPNINRSGSDYVVTDKKGNKITFSDWTDTQEYLSNVISVEDKKRTTDVSNALQNINKGNLAMFADVTSENERDFLEVKGQFDGLTTQEINSISNIIGAEYDQSLELQKKLITDLGLIDLDTLELNTDIITTDANGNIEIDASFKDRANQAIDQFVTDTISNLDETVRTKLDAFTGNKLKDTIVTFLLNGTAPNSSNALLNQTLREYQSVIRKSFSAVEAIAGVSQRKQAVVGKVKPESISDIISVRSGLIESKLMGKASPQRAFTERVAKKRVSFILTPPKEYFKLTSKLNDPNLTPDERTKIENRRKKIIEQKTFKKGAFSTQLNELLFNKIADIFNNSNTRDELNAALTPIYKEINDIISAKKAEIAKAVSEGKLQPTNISDVYITRLNTALGALRGIIGSKVTNKTDYNVNFVSSNISNYKTEANKAATNIDNLILDSVSAEISQLNITTDTLVDFFNITEDILNSGKFSLSSLENVDAILAVLGKPQTTNIDKINLQQDITNKINLIRSESERIFKPEYIRKINDLLQVDTSSLNDDIKNLVAFVKEYSGKSITSIREKLKSIENTIYPSDSKQQIDPDAFRTALLEYNAIRSFGAIADKSLGQLLEADRALGAIVNGETTAAADKFTQQLNDSRNAIKDSFGSDEQINKTAKTRYKKLNARGLLSYPGMFADFLTGMSNSLLTFKSLVNIITKDSKIGSQLTTDINNGFLAVQDDITDIQNTLDTELDFVRDIPLATQSKSWVFRNKDKNKSRFARRQFLFDMVSPSSTNQIEIELTNKDSGLVETRNITQALAGYILNIHDQEILRDALSRKGITDKTIEQIRKNIDPSVDLLRNRLKTRVRDNFQKSNIVHKEMHGYESNIDYNFYPVRFEFSGRPTMADPFAIQQQAGGQRMGFDNSIIDPTEELDLDFETQSTNLISMFYTHSYESSHWRNLIKPLTNAKYAFSGVDVKDRINKLFGKETTAELNAFIQAFETGGIASGYLNTKLGNYISRATSAFAKNVMGYKLSTMITNTFSFGNTLLDTSIPFKQALISYVKVATGTARATSNDIWKSEAIQRRVSSGSNSLIAMAKAPSLLSKPKWYDEFSASSLGAMSYFDAKGGSIAAAAAYDAHYSMSETNNPNFTEEQHQQAAFAGMMETINKTFQPLVISGKSTYEMISNPIIKFFTLFQSENRKNLGLEIETIRKKGVFSWDMVRMVAVNHMLFGGLVWAVKSAIRDFLDNDDDEIFDEKHWNGVNASANIIIGPIAAAPILGSVGEWLVTSGLNAFIDLLDDPDIKKARMFDSSDNIIEKGFSEIGRSFSKLTNLGESDDQFEDFVDSMSSLLGGASTVAPTSFLGVLSVVGNIAEQTVDFSKSILD